MTANFLDLYHIDDIASLNSDTILDYNKKMLTEWGENFRQLEYMMNFGMIGEGNVKDGYFKKVTADVIEATEFIVGENVQMGDGAVVSWSNIINPPNMTDYLLLDDFNAAIEDYVTDTNLRTILGEDYIITGKIYANQITAGEIIGFTIYTAPVGEDRIELTQYGLISKSADDKWHGIALESGSFSELSFYYQGNKKGYISYGGGLFAISPYADDPLALGKYDKTTYALGHWDFSETQSFNGLDDRYVRNSPGAEYQIFVINGRLVVYKNGNEEGYVELS
jgi:hypothetical protein